MPQICGSCHNQNVVIGVEFRNCHRILDHLLFVIWMGQIQSKLIDIFVPNELASL